jgi:hypothetical protein
MAKVSETHAKIDRLMAEYSAACENVGALMAVKEADDPQSRALQCHAIAVAAHEVGELAGPLAGLSSTAPKYFSRRYLRQFVLTPGYKAVWDGFKKVQMEMFDLRDAAASQTRLFWEDLPISTAELRRVYGPELPPLTSAERDDLLRSKQWDLGMSCWGTCAVRGYAGSPDAFGSGIVTFGVGGGVVAIDDDSLHVFRRSGNIGFHARWTSIWTFAWRKWDADYVLVEVGYALAEKGSGSDPRRSVALTLRGPGETTPTLFDAILRKVSALSTASDNKRIGQAESVDDLRLLPQINLPS